MGQHYDCGCLSSLHWQDISSHPIDYAGKHTLVIHEERFQLPVPFQQVNDIFDVFFKKKKSAHKGSRSISKLYCFHGNITHHPHQTGWRPHSWHGHWGPHEPPSWQRVLTSLETRSKHRSMQLNAVITFNITWCCTQHCGDWDTTSIKFKARYGGSNMKKNNNGCRLLISCMMEGIKKVNFKNGILWLFSVTDPPKIQDGRHI